MGKKFLPIVRTKTIFIIIYIHAYMFALYFTETTN